MHGFYRCLNLCVVLNFDISNIDYTSSLMYMIEISKVYAHRDKTTLKLSHQICMQSRLLSVATPCPLVLPHLLNDAFL